MKPIPRDVSPPEKHVSPPAASLNEFSPRERWFVRGLIALAITIIAAGLWQTVGRDALLATRRLPVFRRVASRPNSNTKVAANRQESQTDSTHSLSAQSASSGLTGLPSTSRSFDERSALNNAARPAANTAAVDGEAKPLADQPLIAKETASPDKPVPRDKPGAVEVVSVDLLQAAAQLVSLGWQDFAYPATWFASETSKPRMLYNSHRNSLLNAIAHPQPSALSLTQSRKDYAAAIEQFRDDPRLDYAFGLALWHHGERSEALEVFQTAARLEGTPFLPAALAVGWGRLLDGEERRGLDQLSHVAKLLGSSSEAASTENTPLAPAGTAASVVRGEGPGVRGSFLGVKPVYPTEPQREYAALCLGRAFGFLTGPGRTTELGEAADLTARNVRERLPADLLSEFEVGFAQVGQRQSDLLQFASLPENALATEHRQQSDELQTRIDTLRAEMKETRDELARDHLSYLTTITQYVTDTLKARAESSKLQPLAKKVKDSIMQLYQPQPHAVMRSPSGELVPVSSSPSSTTGSRTSRTTSLGSSSSSSRSSSRNGQNSRGSASRSPQIFLMPETTQERAARVAKLEKARTELKRIQTELATLRERHKALLDQKHQADAEQKAETKEQQQAQADRRREQRDLEQKLKELNTALRQMQSLHNSLDTVAAYVPWTIPVEGAALRQALIKKPDPATNAAAQK